MGVWVNPHLVERAFASQGAFYSTPPAAAARPAIQRDGSASAAKSQCSSSAND